MRYWRTIQSDCPSCHGRGEVYADEERADGYWIAAFECHCVEHHHDDEMKGFLKGVTALVSQANRGEHG
jgi:hypothetical protein